VTRNNLAKRLGGLAAGTVALFALASVFSGSAAAVNSLPAADCVIACVATFDTPSAAESFAVPSGITDLSVTISGAAGAPQPAFVVALVGATEGKGGVTTVDLGTTYAGQSLTLGVGDTGEGSYLQSGSTLLAVAGGGGGGGYIGRLAVAPGDQIFSSDPGGDGGAPTGPGIAAGGDGTAFGGSAANGGGGGSSGGVAGTGSEANGTAGGGTTTTTGAGSTLATGGAGATMSVGGHAQVAGSGGTGYRGGGGGGFDSVDAGDGIFQDVVGAGGGGAGFLVSGLTGTLGTPNAGTGSVVLTYSFSPTITTTATTVHRGDNVPVTITGLPANTAFSVTFDGGTVVTGTSDGSGDATESFIVSSSAAAGHFPLNLLVGGISVATSDPVSVIVTLATTGGPSPELPAMVALLLLAAGAMILIARRRVSTN
jgi:hypothetical protein